MKKILTFILLIISVAINAQTPVYDGLDVYGGITGRKDAFINDSLRTPKVNTDTIVFGDGTIQTSSATGSVDSVFIENLGIWIVDTLPVIDSFNLCKIDTLIVGIDTTTGVIDLKTAVETEIFDKLQLDTSTQAYSEGTIHYNASKKAVTFYNDITGFSHELGYELVKRVYNNSGSLIPNGRVIVRTGTHINDARVPTVGLAGNSTKDSARVCGMATVDIPNNSYGIALIIGDANFLNTSALSEDEYYLGNAGQLIDTSPPPPAYSVELGCVIYSDSDSGIVSFFPRQIEYNPTPIIDADTTGWAETIDLTQNVYSKFQISEFPPNQEYGFTQIGDSIRCDISGYIEVTMNTSYTGSTVSATWRKGVFLNGINKHSVSRSTTSQSVGNSTVVKLLNVSVNDYISFRITNTTGDQDPVINDFSYNIQFIHE